MPTQHPHFQWQPTGEIRVITGWFGVLRVQREEDRHVTAPQRLGGGHQPRQTVLEKRWRRAPRGLPVTL